MTMPDEPPWDPGEEPPEPDDRWTSRHGRRHLATAGTPIPPHNLEAEESLIGAMLLSGSAIDAALEAHITPTDFYGPNYALICRAVYRLHSTGTTVDLVTVGEELRRQKLLDQIGGNQTLLELQAGTPASSRAGHYARIVHELAWPRQLIALAGDLTDTAYGYTGDHATSEAITRVLTHIGEHARSPEEDEDLDEWSPLDLGPALRGELVPIIPGLLWRDDQRAAFYPAQINGIHGDSGLGKSWLAIITAAQELNVGRHVQWVNLEDPDAQPTIERLRSLGICDETIHTHMHYHSPNTPFTAEAVNLLAAEAEQHQTSLLVIDSIGEAFGLEGLDENADKDVGPWYRRVPRILAASGPAILVIDHATKAADNPLHPSGSKRKRAAITGASYLVEAPIPLTRENGGRLQITCAKDRHGHYRRGEIVATIDFKIYPDGGLSVKIWPPAPKETNRDDQRLQTVARVAVRSLKAKGEPLSTRRLLEVMTVKARRDTKLAAIEEAVARGAIRTDPGPRGTTLHSYVQDLPKTTEENPE